MKIILNKICIIYLKIKIWNMDRRIRKARRDLDESVKANHELRKKLGLPPAWDLKK